MANLPEKQEWIDGIYQLETSDPVVGGPGGVSNRQAEQLADRTAYLKKELESTGEDLQAHIDAADPHTQYAPKASPALTGTPTAPTAAQAANSNQIATTAFVKAAITALVNGSPAALDTLQELAKALGNDPNFSATVLNKLTQKLEKEQNGADIPDKAEFMANIGLKSAATRAVGSAASDIPDITVGDGRYLGKTATAAAATKLAAARKIAGVSFDGTADIALTPANVGALATTGGTLTGNLISKAADALRIIYGAYGVIQRNDGVDFNILLTNKDDVNGSWNTLRPLRINLATGNIHFTHTANATILQEKGQRVYSPNNKPTAADVGALPANGGSLTGNVTITNDSVIKWERNTDYATIGFNSENDASTNYMYFRTGDNGNEYFRWEHIAPTSSPAAEWMSLKADGLRIKGNLAYHTGNKPTAADVGAIGAGELAGIPLPYPSATAPAGWLKCNGQAFDKAKYPKLAALYSSGKLPDLRGEFIRGWDDARGVDASRVMLSAQDGTVESHNHAYRDRYFAEATGDDSSYLEAIPANHSKFGSHSSDGDNNHFAFINKTTANTGSNETRPRNIAFNYIVRAA